MCGVGQVVIAVEGCGHGDTEGIRDQRETEETERDLVWGREGSGMLHRK